MQERDRINELIPTLAPRTRTAFAIACFERTLPLVAWYFGPNQADHVRQAIELCWNYAESGIESRDEVENAIAHFAAVADELYDDDEGGSPYLYAINALYWSLRSVIAPEAKTVETAVGFAASAAAAEDEIKLLESNIDEETSWQLRALLAAQMIAPNRQMFQSLSAKPNWLVRFESRVPPRPEGQ